MKKQLRPHLTNEPGWTGAFTRARADGALGNGTRIIKRASEPKDGTPDGTPGTVLGSLDASQFPGRATPFVYFIEWDTTPRVAVAVASWKVEAYA